MYKFHLIRLFKRYAITDYVRHISYSKNIDKVLIANRGEIACRIIKTARLLGIKSVAVFSDADKNSLHVSMADEAYNIGLPAPSESYLRGDKLIDVAKRSGCQAVHPGYGFLSENAEFADICQKSSIIFIGPPSSAIRDMGIKSTSKAIMENSGVPVIKGYHGSNQSDVKLKEEADRIGYPVLLKAIRGGGGKGMRIAHHASEFFHQLTSARNEARKAFGDDSMLVEQFVARSRHVEVQIFADKFGNCVHLFERDCSVQRRHQKIIEEAPAPGLPSEIRKALGSTAVQAAKAVSYVGAGTVEFILDTNTFQYYFMEMNTRLQVEHPITEMITGTDLVEWQFKIANGEKLPLTQEDLNPSGHAFEARIYAEDPDGGFLPSAGFLNHLESPEQSPQVRVETGVREKDEIPVFYDPMIAKLVVWGPDRSSALHTLRKSLKAYHVSGVPTNINFLLSLSSHEEFVKANVHTNFIPEYEKDLFQSKPLDDTILCQAVFALLHSQIKKIENDPFYDEVSFRLNHFSKKFLKLIYGKEDINIEVNFLNSSKLLIKFSGRIFHVEGKAEGLKLKMYIDGRIISGKAIVNSDSIEVFGDTGVVKLMLTTPKYVTEIEGSLESNENLSVSPMPGVVDQIFVSENMEVTKGQPLVTVIAMKMEYVIRAPRDGCIEQILYKSGESVAKGSPLVRLLDQDKLNTVKN